MDESICIKFPQSDNKTENPLALLFISFPKSKRSFLHSMTSFVKNYFPFYDMKIIHEKLPCVKCAISYLRRLYNKSNFHTSVQPEASRNSSVEKQTVVIIAKSVNSAKCERTMWFRIEWPDSIYISFGWEIFHCAKAIPPQRRGGEVMTFATTLVLFQVHSSTVSFQRGISSGIGPLQCNWSDFGYLPKN